MKTKVPPLVILVILGGFMLAADRFAPGRFDFQGREWVGVLFVTIGILLTGLGVQRFRASATTVDPRRPGEASALVTSGVYRFTRNPMYLGFASVLVGWAFYLGTALGFLAMPLFVLWMNLFQIAGEETALERRFGKAYAEYRGRVRRWI